MIDIKHSTEESRLPTNEEIHQVREQINHYYRTSGPSKYTDISGWVIDEGDITITRTDKSVTITILLPPQGGNHDFGECLGEGLKVTYANHSVTLELIK